MDSPADWPSLADELELADELFGRRGYDLLASWLESEAARVDDPDFARLLPITSTFLEWRPTTTCIVASAPPRARSWAVSVSTDAISAARSCRSSLTASMSSTAYATVYVKNGRCSRRPSFGYGPPPGRLTGANVVLDASIYAARCRDVRPPASHVWLEPFGQVEAAEAMVRARYQRLNVSDGDRRNVLRPGCRRRGRTICPSSCRWLRVPAVAAAPRTATPADRPCRPHGPRSAHRHGGPVR